MIFVSPRGRESRRRCTRVASLVGLASLVATFTGCGDDTVTAADPTTTSTAPGRSIDPSAPAATFAIDPALPGWTVATATEGTDPPEFSSDSFGGVHPMVVLVPDDWSGLDDHRWIEVTTIDGSGNEGGFLQELPAYTHVPGPNGNTVIGGHAALAMSVGTTGEPGRRTAAFVTVATDAGASDPLETGSRRGILVTGPEEDLDLFKKVAAATTVDDERTPNVDPVPEGLRVLGTLTAAQAMTSSDQAPDHAPEGRRLLELRPDTSDGSPPDVSPLLVTALAGNGDTALLKAIEAMWDAYDVDDVRAVTTVRIGGSDAYLSTCCATTEDVPLTFAKAWFTVDGHPFSASGPSTVLGTPELVTTLASHIKVVDDSQWTASTTPTTVPPIGSGLPTTVAVAPPTSG